MVDEGGEVDVINKVYVVVVVVNMMNEAGEIDVVDNVTRSGEVDESRITRTSTIST